MLGSFFHKNKLHIDKKHIKKPQKILDLCIILYNIILLLIYISMNIFNTSISSNKSIMIQTIVILFVLIIIIYQLLLNNNYKCMLLIWICINLIFIFIEFTPYQKLLNWIYKLFQIQSINKHYICIINLIFVLYINIPCYFKKKNTINTINMLVFIVLLFVIYVFILYIFIIIHSNQYICSSNLLIIQYEDIIDYIQYLITVIYIILLIIISMSYKSLIILVYLFPYLQNIEIPLHILIILIMLCFCNLLNQSLKNR